MSEENKAKLEAHLAQSGVSADQFTDAPGDEELPETESKANNSFGIEFQKEHGLWVLRTGTSMPLSMINDAVQAVRREREDKVFELIPR